MHTWTDLETAPFLTPWREATVRRVVDGDTLDLLIDLGYEVHIHTRVRLLSEGELANGGVPYGVNAWETRGADKERGLLAKARVEGLCPAGATVRVFSMKGGYKGKYGRWLVVILYRVGAEWRSLGDQLLLEGHASPYVG